MNLRMLSLLAFLISGTAQAQQRKVIPCFDQMYEILQEFVDKSEGQVNVVVELVSDEGSDRGLKSAKLSYNAPKEINDGTTVTLIVKEDGGKCPLQYRRIERSSRSKY